MELVEDGHGVPCPYQLELLLVVGNESESVIL
jgi:hypothetical protein